MKTFSFLLTLLVLVSHVDARENPFEPTKTYVDEMQRMLEVEVNPSAEFREKPDSEYEYPKESMKKPVGKTPEQIKAELATKKAQAMKKELAMKLKAAEAAKKAAQNNPMIYVKMRNDVVVDKKIDVLPFLNLEYTNTQLKIHSKYKVFKKFYLEEENKLILDFKGFTKFYTRHFDLEGKAFKKFSIGNHREERFFRVVIVLKEPSDQYDVSYDQDMVLVSLSE